MTIDRESLSRPFDSKVIQQREGPGRKMFDYVEWNVVVHRLNDVCGDEGWSFEITDQFVHTNLEGVSDFVVIGTMSIPGLGTRSGIGVQRLAGNYGEDAFKGAKSDCLKVCAVNFGIGLHLYGPDREAGEVASAAGTGTSAPRHSASGQTLARTTTSQDDEEKRVTRPGDPPSEKQIKWLEALLRERQAQGHDVASHLVAVENTKNNRGWQINRATASEWIDDMTKRQQIPVIADDGPKAEITSSVTTVSAAKEKGGVPTDKRARLMVRNDSERTVWTNILRGLDNERETMRQLLHIANLLTEGSDDPVKESWRYELLIDHAPVNGEIVDGIATTAEKFGAMTPDLEDRINAKLAMV